MVEIWKDIQGYEGLYQVSNLGNVKRILFINGKSKINREKILNLFINAYGYKIIKLSKNNKTEHKQVHRLVSNAFINNIENKEQVNHIDGNKSNNNVNNLEWCTRSENMIHAYKNNLIRKPKIIQYNLKGELIKIWESMIEIEKNLKIGNSHISQCCNNKRKTTGGFIWKYKEEIE